MSMSSLTRPVLVAGLLVLTAASAAAQAAPESLGTFDPRWRMITVDGTPVELATFRGDVLIINVWATWCRPCVTEMPSLQALHEAFAGRGVRVLAVAADRPGPVSRFLRRHQLDLPVFLESDPFPPSLGVSAVPTTLVVDQRGNIVLRHRGAADWNRPEVHAFLEALLANSKAGGKGSYR
ncbi:MAG TPA: TlpA disulfide reductase family protein [Gemmatimonadales bacterium]|nr:TlpA disulfide reductase family protein [Gemmatimonadales bacterium]